MSDSVQPHRRQPTRLPRPWDSPGKNTGVGCHFLLQCMKVKSESEVAQSCPTLSDPIDCSLPGSSIHGIFQARVLKWGAIASRTYTCIHSPPNSPSIQATTRHCEEVPIVVVQSKLCLTLSDPMDCSPLGSSIHGIFQARVLEWGAIAFSDFVSTCFYFEVVLCLVTQFAEFLLLRSVCLVIHLCSTLATP